MVAEATTAAGVTVDQEPGVLGFNTSLRWQAMKAFFSDYWVSLWVLNMSLRRLLCLIVFFRVFRFCFSVVVPSFNVVLTSSGVVSMSFSVFLVSFGVAT